MTEEDEGAPNPWWPVPAGTRFPGCAANTESSTEVGITSPVSAAVRCGRCGSDSALQLRDGRFRCRDTKECDEMIAGRRSRR